MTKNAATKRWKYLPEFIAAGMVPVLYFVMTRVGMNSSDAQVYAAATGALFWATTLWWRGQAPLREDEQITPLKAVAVAALITAVAFLIETLTAEFVLDISSTALNAAHATAYDEEHVRIIVNRYFAIPLGAAFLFALGFRSARKLRVKRPLLWFLGIVLIWYSIRFAIYVSAGENLGKQYGFHMPTLTTALVQTIPITALSYAALIAGNFFGRRRYGRAVRQSTRRPQAETNASEEPRT
jgi:hypothetical protein